MLTGFQIERVAYIGDGYIICRDCALKRAEAEIGSEAVEEAVEGSWSHDDEVIEGATGLSALDRYSAEESFGDEGLYCEDCYTEIVERWEDEEDEDDA